MIKTPTQEYWEYQENRKLSLNKDLSSSALRGNRLDHRLGYLFRPTYSRGATPLGKIRITLALVRSFAHIPYLINAIYRSFQISYFPTDHLRSLFYASFYLSVLKWRVQWRRQFIFCMGSPFPIVLWAPLIIYRLPNYWEIQELHRSRSPLKLTGYNYYYY